MLKPGFYYCSMIDCFYFIDQNNEVEVLGDSDIGTHWHESIYSTIGLIHTSGLKLELLELL